MAKFSVYAEVLTDNHPQSKLYAAGKVTRQPGRLLRSYLDESGGRYEVRLPIPDELRASVRRVAELTADKTLASTARLTDTVISLEHLRDLDPDTTRIVVGHRLDYSYEEAVRLGLADTNPNPQDRVSG